MKFHEKIKIKKIDTIFKKKKIIKKIIKKEKIN